MLISYRNKFIFIHNYKVAGSSVTKALKNYGLINPIFKSEKINKFIEQFSILRKIHNSQFLIKVFKFLNLNKKISFHSHMTGEEVIKIFSKEIWDSFYKFGFVRNPWDWQVSLYHFMLQKPGHHQHDLVKSMKNFDEYIRWRINKDLHLQKEFFYDGNGNCIVDFIGKLENLDQDFKKICNKIGIEAELPHKNKSKRKRDYRKYYTEETKKLVEKAFREDIELFYYEF
jgi:hypothetical protein